MQNISECRSAALPYCGILNRGQNYIETFSDALAFVWTYFGQGVDFQSYETAYCMSAESSDGAPTPKLVVG